MMKNRASFDSLNDRGQLQQSSSLRFSVMILLFLLLIHGSYAFLNDVFQKVQNDFFALTRRVTARHILVSNTEIATALKQKIRTECIDQQRYVVDVFEEAAIKYSRDDTTNFRGGLLGTLVPQGYCVCPTLDRACFEVSLGQVVGPFETDYGHHLLLVTERTNCPKLDGDKTLLMQTRGDDIFGTLVVPPTSNSPDVLRNPAQMVLDQLAFWFVVMIAGGIVAELAEKIV
ncbi:peptidyl-prolyl cis-trans isomerase [Nitzschia inconspicua]|uniref:Peptidyl-prolyl cis-trans isomerase n=1 Tax=Nitzschia inconspicua TaxID=303405 RepID=A0A9K3KBY8_9STRA|nr:peptidyl-prolyl cis-trans isomerase [Nitzschia inconspicua]